MHQFTKSIGPYTFVSKEETRSFETPDGVRTFRFLIYGAYNAMGLIGSEKNGIAILDEDKVAVLCDEIAKEISGYNQPSAASRLSMSCCRWIGKFSKTLLTFTNVVVTLSDMKLKKAKKMKFKPRNPFALPEVLKKTRKHKNKKRCIKTTRQKNPLTED